MIPEVYLVHGPNYILPFECSIVGWFRLKLHGNRFNIYCGRTVDKVVLDGLDRIDRPEDPDVITLVTGQMVDNPEKGLGGKRLQYAQDFY